jgi:hypothetical protein
MTIRWSLLQLRHHKLLAVAAVALGTLTILASTGLMTTSGYLLSRAALRPPILELTLVIVAVRFFGITRGPQMSNPMCLKDPDAQAAATDREDAIPPARWVNHRDIGFSPKRK